MTGMTCIKCPHGRYGNPHYINEKSIIVCGSYSTCPDKEHIHYRCNKCNYLAWSFCMDHK